MERPVRALAEPAFAPRDVLGGKDARPLARQLLGMTQDEFSASFQGSPMRRAKRRGLVGNVGTHEDVPVLAHALDDAEPLVREYAAWVLGRLRALSHDEVR